MTAENRLQGLQFALAHGPETITPAEAPDMIKVAELYRLYLDGTTVRLVFTVMIDGVIVPFTTLPGGTMPTIAVAATVDDNTVTFAVNPQDDHQDSTADQLTAVSDDTSGTVGTFAAAADTHGGVLTLNHVEGTVNVTFSDPSAPAVEALVFAVTVGAGATSALSGTATVA